MNSLPSSVNYAEVLPSLPENSTRYSVALQPTNGSLFGPSSQIQFQFPNRGYLISDSLYLKYKVLHASTAAAAQATTQGWEGVTSMATQTANMIPLYANLGGGNKSQTEQGLAKNAVIGSNGKQLTGTGSNIQWNPTGTGMPTLNQNQQPINILGNQMQSNPVTSFYPDFQVNPFTP